MSQQNVVIDHLAIAVRDLESSVRFYVDTLGFELKEYRETKGKVTAMLSAVVVDKGGFSIVLMEGVGPDSQITRYVEKYGAGVQHVAFLVDDVEKEVAERTAAGLEFSTSIIRGQTLKQAFSKRDLNSGMMFEFIERIPGKVGFENNNIQNLFESLEKTNAY